MQDHRQNRGVSCGKILRSHEMNFKTGRSAIREDVTQQKRELSLAQQQQVIPAEP